MREEQARFASNLFGRSFKPFIPFTLAFGFSSHSHTLVEVSRRWFFVPSPFGLSFKPFDQHALRAFANYQAYLFPQHFRFAWIVQTNSLAGVISLRMAK